MNVSSFLFSRAGAPKRYENAIPVLLGFLLLAAPGVAQAQFTFTTNGHAITITGYTGPGGAVTIPTNINGLTVTAIGLEAFLGNTNMSSLTIPCTVTSIGESALDLCRLTAITVDPNNTAFSSVDGVLFDKGQTTLIQYPQSSPQESYVIPETVATIEEGAFINCTGLTNITLPDSFASIADEVFEGCTGLASFDIPSSVTTIGVLAFEGCASLTSITIPSSVTSIGPYAFVGCSSMSIATVCTGVTSLAPGVFAVCTNLAAVYFQGNAPTVDGVNPYEDTAFSEDNIATVYYLPGTTGWSNIFDEVPAVLWNPLIQTRDGHFGVRNNQFGFDITGTTNIAIVVEACTNLANPVWTPLTNVTLTNGSFHFSDPQWTNYPGRFYGIGFP
jgi:hypothetical protein